VSRRSISRIQARTVTIPATSTAVLITTPNSIPVVRLRYKCLGHHLRASSADGNNSPTNSTSVIVAVAFRNCRRRGCSAARFIARTTRDVTCASDTAMSETGGQHGSRHSRRYAACRRWPRPAHPTAECPKISRPRARQWRLHDGPKANGGTGSSI